MEYERFRNARTLYDGEDEFGFTEPPYTEDVNHANENTDDPSVDGSMACVFIPERKDNLRSRNLNRNRNGVGLQSNVRISGLSKRAEELT